MPSDATGWLTAAGLIIGAYLCGSIPFGLLVGMFRGVDIRTRGSGNIGATNAGRVLGRPFGVLVFALDMLKGLLPVAIAGAVLARLGAGTIETAGPTRCLIWLGTAAGAIGGHMFPVHLGFKGGKGVATSLGVVLGIYPYYTLPGLIAAALWVVVTLLTRYVSVGSMVAAVAFPVLFTASMLMGNARSQSLAEVWPLYVFCGIVAGLVIYRHRSNLRRLMQGTEPRIGAARTAPSDQTTATSPREAAATPEDVHTPRRA
jgi:glycerol-3-phosphate acyltransferase PlsY